MNIHHMPTRKLKDTTDATPVLTAQQAIQVAAEMVPRLTARASESERMRRVHPDSIAELRSSGLMRLMQPARFGGSELGLDDLMNVVFEIARGCPSTAWVYSNLASHSWNLGQFELQAQEDIWADDPHALAATGLAFPCGRAVPVDGGYRLTGLWPFGSGVDASTWMLVGAMTERAGGAPERRFFLVPQADFKSMDNWSSYG